MSTGIRAVRLAALLRRIWGLVREWAGDAAYERYFSRSGGAAPLSREAFYLDSLRRRYHSPARCC